MINLAPKLPELDALLLDLLRSLRPEEWQAQTVARLWKVKDVAAHLLDGNIRILSGLRDAHLTEPPEIRSYEELVRFLNQLNHEWVQAMKRVSPQMLIELLAMTGPPFCEYYASLDLHAKAAFPVAWAGENESTNWMHIAREYTEKFLHQQQIRDAVNKPGLLNEPYFRPFLDVCMFALPHTLRNQEAMEGDSLVVNIKGSVSVEYVFRHTGKNWQRQEHRPVDNPTAEVWIDSDAAWKLFSKSRRAGELGEFIQVSGYEELANKALDMVAFMA